MLAPFVIDIFEIKMECILYVCLYKYVMKNWYVNFKYENSDLLDVVTGS